MHATRSQPRTDSRHSTSWPRVNADADSLLQMLPTMALLDCYRLRYPDIQKQVTDPEQLWLHWSHHGQKEGVCAPPLPPSPPPTPVSPPASCGSEAVCERLVCMTHLAQSPVSTTLEEAVPLPVGRRLDVRLHGAVLRIGLTAAVGGFVYGIVKGARGP